MKPENIGPHFQARKISKEMSQGSRDRQVKEGRSKGSKGEGKIKKKMTGPPLFTRDFRPVKCRHTSNKYSGSGIKLRTTASVVGNFL